MSGYLTGLEESIYVPTRKFIFCSLIESRSEKRPVIRKNYWKQGLIFNHKILQAFLSLWISGYFICSHYIKNIALLCLLFLTITLTRPPTHVKSLCSNLRKGSVGKVFSVSLRVCFRFPTPHKAKQSGTHL